MTEQQGVTAKEMCETIARYLKETQGMDIAPEAIYNASPTGELVNMIQLYQEAKAFYKHDKETVMQFLEWINSQNMIIYEQKPLANHHWGPTERSAEQLVAAFLQWREQQ